MVLRDGEVHGLGHAGTLTAAMVRAEREQAALACLVSEPDPARMCRRA